MNLYHVMIDLQDDAKALAFAGALRSWMDHLQEKGVIGRWRLLRRKLDLAGPGARDFLLEVEVSDLAQLDEAFRVVGGGSEEVERLHRLVHQMIARKDCALYRPFPDPERAERMSLV